MGRDKVGLYEEVANFAFAMTVNGSWYRGWKICADALLSGCLLMTFAVYMGSPVATDHSSRACRAPDKVSLHAFDMLSAGNVSRKGASWFDNKIACLTNRRGFSVQSYKPHVALLPCICQTKRLDLFVLAATGSAPDILGRDSLRMKGNEREINTYSGPPCLDILPRASE
jgi:hypothetical protein